MSIVTIKGTEETWYAFLDGILVYHRDNGIARTNTDGTKIWYKDGKVHNIAGPAILYADGKVEYCIDNILFTFKDYIKKLLDMNPMPAETKLYLSSKIKE